MEGRPVYQDRKKSYRSMAAASATNKETPLLSARTLELPPNYHATQQTSQRRLQLRREFSSKRRHVVNETGDNAVFDQVFTGDSPRPHHIHRKKTTRDVGSPQEEVFNKPKKHRHSFLYSMLNPKSQQWQAVAFKFFITTVILSDMLLFILSTDQKMWDNHSELFKITEGVVSTIFLIEYIARLYVIPEKKKYSGHFGRLKYATTTVDALIDLLATAPFFVELATGWELPTLTVLRMFRLFRILKTESYVRAIDAVYRVIYYNSEILYVAFLVCIFLTVVTAVLLYYLRPREDDTNFESIGATLYMSTLMLTGQGGPDGDLPWYTKLVVLLTSVFSVAMFAIPASMLTWGFEAEAARMAKRARKRALENRSEGSSSATTTSTSSSSSCDDSEGYSTDEEYFKMIAGDESDSDTEETPWMKQIRESFQNADLDKDGNLTLAEATGLIAKSQAEGSFNNAEVMTRISQLEAKVDANNAKLERILQMLQPK